VKTALTPEELSARLAERRFETARRIGLRLIEVPEFRTRRVILDLREALGILGDLRSAMELLQREEIAKALDPFTVALGLANDYRLLTQHNHYRVAAENKAGLTFEEYEEKYLALSAAELARAEALAETQEQRAALAACKDREQKIAAPEPAKDESPAETVSLSGRVALEDGSSAAGATVTLGLHTETELTDADIPKVAGLGHSPRVGAIRSLTTRSDAEGRFAFAKVPRGRHDYLAVTLDPARFEIPTHFVAREVAALEAGGNDLGTLTIRPWKSASPAEATSPHPEEIDGRRKIGEVPLHNPFAYDFATQLLRIPLPPGAPARLRLRITPEEDEPFQIVAGEIVFFTSLPAKSRSWIAIYEGDAAPPAPALPVRLAKESDSVWRIDSGVASFRIAADHPPEPVAPLIQIMAADGVWRGAGRFRLPEGGRVVQQTTRVIEEGPLLLQVEIVARFGNGKSWAVTLTALAGQPYILAHEKSDAWDGAAFEFSLREFSGGRGFLNWVPELGSTHWTTLGATDEEVGRLPESIPWWIPPQGFAYSMTPDGLDERDYLSVFSIRRGEWIDREFARIAQGPIDENGRENRELDWPFPEMVGSSISWITANTSADGDAFFRFAMYDGERHWGILASSLQANDGPQKLLAAVQHGNSSPRLQEFKDWHFDQPDAVERPHVLVERPQILSLRRKQELPAFGRIFRKIRFGKVGGSREGLAFALSGDPEIAWRKRIGILCDLRVRTRMTLLGRDEGDLYSPVGGRAITQMAEEYDLIAASGVFSPEEEREVRAGFILLGHLFMECDFMNWRFNSRNANFEADRVEIVGTIGMVFEGHRDSPKFLDHAIERTGRALQIYCTPGSGKWYENPACYYLHALKCRLNLVYHLAKRGMIDLTAIARLKEFLRWAVVLLTPEIPTSYGVMRDGPANAFAGAEKVRRIPPIGDHAGIGRWIPEHHALFGKLFLKFDPEFGQELLNAYFCSNGDGARLLRGVTEDPPESEETGTFVGAAGAQHGNLPLFFAEIEEGDLPRHPQIHLASRKLEGFGAVIRDHFNTPRETYLLIKQGPGGYRYHRTEGSFLLFADGKPLVYDGGEAGETWRHSTLSFFDTHLPLSAGRVERALFDPAFQFVQGVHPEIVRPGEPVFLSDLCDHRLVPEAYRRFRKDPPAAVRSYAWVGGRYLVLHDALAIDPAIPSHWHLQVVADAETGSAAEGYRFQGRFGLDLAVQLPGQRFSAESVTEQPILEYHATPEECFAMRHLQLDGTGANSYLAVLMPLASGKPLSLSTESISIQGQISGVRVRSEGIDDIVWMNRAGCQWHDDGIAFRGRYGALLSQGGKTSLVLGDAGAVSWRDVTLESDGAAVRVTLDSEKAEIASAGAGEIRLCQGGRLTTFQSTRA